MPAARAASKVTGHVGHNGATCSAWTTTRRRSTCARSRTSRFKLLAIVPTISGAAVAFLSRGRPAGELLAVGLIGLAATLGVVLYEVRNTQLYDYAVRRAKELEARLGAGLDLRRIGPAGLFTERPGRDIGVSGSRSRATSVGSPSSTGPPRRLELPRRLGRLRALDVGGAQKIGGIVGS